MVSDLTEWCRCLLSVSTLPLKDEISIGLSLSHSLEMANLSLYHHGFFDSATHQSLKVLCHVCFLQTKLKLALIKLAGR